MPGRTIYWASLMVGVMRHVYVLTPFIGWEARFASHRALRCWDASGSCPQGALKGYSHALYYDGGRWGVGVSHNTPESFRAAVLLDDEYPAYWMDDPRLMSERVAERLEQRRGQIGARLEEVEAKAWDVIEHRLPVHPRTQDVIDWYTRWKDPDHPIIAHESQWTHLYNREYPNGDGSTWWAADIAEYLAIAEELRGRGRHPVRLADRAAEAIFASWVRRAVLAGDLVWP